MQNRDELLSKLENVQDMEEIYQLIDDFDIMDQETRTIMIEHIIKPGNFDRLVKDAYAFKRPGEFFSISDQDKLFPFVIENFKRLAIDELSLSNLFRVFKRKYQQNELYQLFIPYFDTIAIDSLALRSLAYFFDDEDKKNQILELIIENFNRLFPDAAAFNTWLDYFTTTDQKNKLFQAFIQAENFNRLTIPCKARVYCSGNGLKTANVHSYSHNVNLFTYFNTKEQKAILFKLFIQPDHFNRIVTDKKTLRNYLKYFQIKDIGHENILSLLLRPENADCFVTKVDHFFELSNYCITKKQKDKLFQLLIHPRIFNIMISHWKFASLTTIFPEHSELFQQSNPELARKKARELTHAEMLYTKGAVAGMLFAQKLPPETCMHIGGFLDRKTGANVALTCKKAAYTAEGRSELFEKLERFQHFNEIFEWLNELIDNQDADSIHEICIYLLEPNKFNHFITDIGILQSFYEIVVSQTNEDLPMQLLTNLLFQPERFNYFFNDQYSFEFIVKYCYHNPGFITAEQKNKVFMLILSGKIDFHLFVTHLRNTENVIDTPDEDFKAKLTSRITEMILKTLAESFPGHDDIFKQPTLELACAKIQELRELSKEEKAYTQGAVAGMLFFTTPNASTVFKDIGMYIGSYLDRKTGTNVALTCTQAAKEAEAQRNEFRK